MTKLIPGHVAPPTETNLPTFNHLRQNKVIRMQSRFIATTKIVNPVAPIRVVGERRKSCLFIL